MSKIGKKPIIIPEAVDILISDNKVSAKGPKGELSTSILFGVNIEMKDNTILVTTADNKAQTRMNWGTTRSLIQNIIDGVTNGFKKVLEINGVGYKAEISENKLVLKVGFSHPVEIVMPEGVEIKTDRNKIFVSGINKELVGQVAANIRKVKKPEPYLGKGIKYEDEVIKRKAGKRATGATT